MKKELLSALKNIEYTHALTQPCIFLLWPSVIEAEDDTLQILDDFVRQSINPNVLSQCQNEGYVRRLCYKSITILLLELTIDFIFVNLFGSHLLGVLPTIGNLLAT